MRIILRARSWYVVLAITAVLLVIFLVMQSLSDAEKALITTTVERGDVTELVSVSGFIEAKNTAALAFPATGKVTEVFVDEGSVVAAGEVLATLASAQLVAERNEASAALSLTQAQLQETLAGATSETRAVSNTKVSNAEQNLTRVSSEQAEKVQNARTALLSSGLEALSTKTDEDAAPPTISGTYSCLDEGEYQLSVYSSGGASGYSYRLSGLESGTSEAATDQPAPLGSCGLYIQFDSDSLYNSSNWIVRIPNERSASYLSNKNSYELALQQQENAIAAAEDALALALEEANVVTASTRSEVVNQRQAAVDQARARIAAIDARLSDRSIVAPFAGVVTDVTVLPGETVTSAPVITVLAEDAFELTARIPEIDITKIALGQAVSIVFDAKSDETLAGNITYISPLATEIDGVAYFETTVTLDTEPEWIRSGLNADLDILVGAATDTLRIPKRFVVTDDGQSSVLLKVGEAVRTQPITVEFSGNDGFVAVSGVEAGDVVVAP